MSRVTPGQRGVLIVGASLAGVTVVDALRSGGYRGPITLVGDEPHRAYARPPLSKGVLKGTESDDSVLLPPLGDDVVFHAGVAATGLDTGSQEVRLANGTNVSYDRLVIATGTSARRLGTLPGEYGVRTLDDAVRLRAALGVARRVVVVGGGFLGMEVASAACALGLQVTVLDIRPPLVPVLGEALGGAIVDAGLAAGLRIVVCPGGVALDDDGSRVTGAVTADGRRFAADVVVTAIGDAPTTRWLHGSGLSLSEQGWLEVDEFARATVTSGAPGSVLGAGDVTLLPTVRGVRRMPHWDNAIAQAKAVATTILEGPLRPYEPDPYFWTEAFGIAVKVAGWLPPTGPGEELVGSMADGSCLLRWRGPDRSTIAAVNHRIPVGRLRRLALEPSAVSLA